MGAISQVLAFHRLEDDSLNGKAMRSRCIEGAPYANLGLIDRVGHEIDGQKCVETERGCAGNGDLPAVLVKLIFVCVVDLREHRIRRFAIWAAHERLAREHRACAYIDDGLKREPNLNGRARRVPAPRTFLRLLGRVIVNLERSHFVFTVIVCFGVEPRLLIRTALDLSSIPDNCTH
jgi:hypothetical protein